MQYQVKAVLFDSKAECPDLKRQLEKENIKHAIPFLGIQAEKDMEREVKQLGVSMQDCFLITNHEQHAKIALKLGMAVAGCVEGHFEVPKAVTLLEDPNAVSVTYLNQMYCHAKGIPAPILETERLFVRELTKEDMEALYTILIREEVSRYLTVKTGTKKEELEKLISYVSYVYSFFEYGYWGVFEKTTGNLVGRAGFKEGSYPLEAGYVLDTPFWGKGMATELLKALLTYAEEELGSEEVLVSICEENKASLRVAEKCGFSFQKKEETVVWYRYVM